MNDLNLLGRPAKSRQSKKFKFYSSPEDLSNRLKVIIGSLNAGNNNPVLKNDISMINDKLLRIDATAVSLPEILQMTEVNTVITLKDFKPEKKIPRTDLKISQLGLFPRLNFPKTRNISLLWVIFQVSQVGTQSDLSSRMTSSLFPGMQGISGKRKFLPPGSMITPT